MTKHKHEAGTCPVCGAEDLDYGVLEIQDESVGYPWECNGCGATGTEWYALEFDGHIVNDAAGTPLEGDDDRDG